MLLCLRRFSKMANPKSALVLIAPGSEEMEAVITVDVLRRGGVNVTLAGVDGQEPVKCSRGVVVVPDKSLKDAASETYDAVVLPGGLGGSDIFCKSPEVGSLLKSQESSGRLVAAICAAPLALKAHGIGLGKNLTSHPSVADQLAAEFKYSEDRVVKDGQLITSRGPGTAFEFGLALVNDLCGKDVVEKITPGMLVK